MTVMSLKKNQIRPVTTGRSKISNRLKQMPHDNYHEYAIVQRGRFWVQPSVIKQKSSEPSQSTDQNVLEHSLEERPLTGKKLQRPIFRQKFVTKKTLRVACNQIQVARLIKRNNSGQDHDSCQERQQHR